MRLVVIIVAALVILGLAGLGLVLAQRGTTSTATAASTMRIALETQEVSALPTRAPVSQIAQATGSEAPPLILQANAACNPTRVNKPENDDASIVEPIDVAAAAE